MAASGRLLNILAILAGPQAIKGNVIKDCAEG